jgi:rubrerythrin
MKSEERIAQIQQLLEAIQTGWPFLLALINERISEQTEQLISQESEQARGAIKELRRLAELPESLLQERDQHVDALKAADADL